MSEKTRAGIAAGAGSNEGDTTMLTTPSPTGKLESKQKPPPGSRSADAQAGSKAMFSERDIVRQLADVIEESDHFAIDAGGDLYRFSGGRYAGRAARYVKSRVKRILIEADQTDRWSSRLASEITEYVSADASTLWERPPTDVLNCPNGLLDLRTRTLRPHSPTHLSTVQIAAIYDPLAACPATEKFVSEVYPSDAVAFAWEFRAWLMRPDMSIQKAIILLGDGANGKSAELAAIQAFLSRENTSAVPLHRLESDRFSVARLLGKLANICPDLPSKHLEGTSVFKALVDNAGDVLTAERKFRDSFDCRPYARLAFSANHVPRSSDSSHAFFRRWLALPFNAVIAEENRIPRDRLDATLADPKELSGVLNRALDALDTIKSRGALTESPSMREALSEMRAITDPFASWLDSHTVADPAGWVTKDELLRQCNLYLDSRGSPIMTLSAIGRAMPRLRPGVEVKQRTVDKELTRVWVGIRLR